MSDGSDTPWPPPLRWPDAPLTDGVVTLDRLTEADVNRVVVGCTDPDTARWLPLPSPYGVAEASAFIRSRQQAAESGQELTFALRGGSDRALAGAVGLTARGRRNEAEIGYWTMPDRRGRGWTARGVVLVARYAFATWPLRRIEIMVADGNDHSRRVAEAAGAILEGLRRNGLPIADGEDAWQYALLASDVEPS